MEASFLAGTGCLYPNEQVSEIEENQLGGFLRGYGGYRFGGWF